MTVTPTPGALKKFRRTPWRFQKTVERPDARDLERFVSTIISAHGNLEAAETGAWSQTQDHEDHDHRGTLET